MDLIGSGEIREMEGRELLFDEKNGKETKIKEFVQ